MKRTYYILFLWISLSAFAPNQSCDVAGSTIGFIQNHTRNGLKAETLNVSRYHTFKALNTLDKSKVQFTECGCTDALQNIEAVRTNLRLATKAKTLASIKVLLERVLEDAESGLEALEQHDTHNSKYASDVLAMNTVIDEKAETSVVTPVGKDLESAIDKALENYKNSLDKVVKTVPCREALVFVNRIYDHCETQLLRQDLTPAKKYYHLRTKQITEEALHALQECEAMSRK